MKCKHDEDYECPVDRDCLVPGGTRSGCMLVAENDHVVVDRYFF